MSQYNKTVLTHAGLELAKRANAGQAKFGITRAVTSADDWSNKTVQDLEEVTTIPNIMQQGIIMDTDEVESNNSVIGVSLCFTNKNLSTGYQVRIIGLYVKEEGQENDFLYAVTTAITPEYMPSFADKVLYRFNTQMYLVIGDAQSVNVVINDGTAVTHGQLDKYKAEVADNLKKLENTHKEDMSHVAKSASVNGGAEILPDSTGKLNLVVPDPDLSKYVSLEQLTEALKTKADKTTVEENLAAKANQSDLDQTNAEVAKKANSADVYTKSEVDSKTSGAIVTAFDIANGTPIKVTDSYTNKWLVDQLALYPFADQINQLKGRQTLDSPDFNSITASGVYYITNNTPANIKNNPVSQRGVLVVSNGNGNRTSQVYYPDDGSPQWCRLLNGSNWLPWYQLSTKKDISNAINKFDLSKVKFRKQYINGDGDKADKTWSATKNDDGTYTIDLYNDDRTAAKLHDVIAQLPSKADTSTVNAQIADVKDTAKSNLDKAKSDLNDAINAKANSSDLTALDKKAVKSVGIFPNNLHFESGSFNYWSDEVKASPDANGYAVIDLTDDPPVRAAADQLNVMLTGLNHLQGKQTKDSADANALSETGVYYCSSPAKNFPVGQWGTLVTSNGNGARASQLYFPDDESAVWFRTFDGNWRGWVRLANIDDVNNAKSSLTSSINAVSDKVNVDAPLFRRITAGNTWNDILGTSNGNPVLVSIRDEGGANTLGNFSAAVAFGGGDTKGVLNVAYSDHTARIIGGNGDAPVWHEDIAWKSDVNDLRNQVQQLRDNQFEVQTFTDATAAANWEAQKPGKRMAIVNS